MTISGTQSLGPGKITGTLTINNAATLIMTGDLYVTGNVIINNNATVKMDISYGAHSGMLVSDGTITMKNGAGLQGSGQTGSYVMLLSTNASTSAISVQNGITGAVLYASAGGIDLNNAGSGANTVNVHQITAEKRVSLGNNITLQYEIGIVNSFFTSCPTSTLPNACTGASKVTSWSEQ